MRPDPTIIWFRQDLRLPDHPALHQAVTRGGPVVPVFIHAPGEEHPWAPGGATKWWLYRSLASLDGQLQQAGSRLTLRCGPSLAALRMLIRETGATAVYWSRRYEPAAMARDAQIKAALREDGIEVESFNASLLWEPWTIETNARTPFKVFTPFWRRCLSTGEPADTLAAPRRIVAPENAPVSLDLAELQLAPKIPWDAGLCEAWSPGAAGAAAELQRFLDEAVADYQNERDRPDHKGTSRLSPFLHFGEIGPRQVWHAVKKHLHERVETIAEPYLRQLVWREFAYHLLYHFPQTPEDPLREEFSRFPWENDSQAIRGWQRGQTGYPYIDAGMRQLWATGWMHNRVRMAVASFLVKDLLVSWQQGARWFWDTLVDADLANNTLGWQWTAGCGADAAPYFRVFNPVSQGEKFDPQGDYVGRWVPELARLPAKWIHQPWAAPPDVLSSSSVHLGKTYPERIVDHAAARVRALEALELVKASRRD